MKNPFFFFILKLHNLWPWPSYINFSNRYDIILNSWNYHLCKYIKGFINIFWKHYKILFQNMTKSLFFFRLFWKCSICDLTMTFTFISIICLGLKIKDTFFYITMLVFFYHLQLPFTKKFKLVKIHFFFILKVDNLWPWPWPSHINFSNRFDIILASCYYYLCEYIKGFINI